MQNVAKIIDQTYLNKNATNEELEKIAEETKEYGFRGLCVFPEHVKLVKEIVGSEIKVTALVDEPTGTSSTEDRLKVINQIKNDGADEADVVMPIDKFKNERDYEVLEDLKQVCAILPTKIIIGSGYLTNKEIDRASKMVKSAGAICVKTATLNDPLDNTELPEKAKHIKIMKNATHGLLIKASGAIRSFADVQMMVLAGADIIGTSSGVEIVNEQKGAKKIKETDSRIIE